MSSALDVAHRAIREQPPYDVRRETWWQYERRLAEAVIDALRHEPPDQDQQDRSTT